MACLTKPIASKLFGLGKETAHYAWHNRDKIERRTRQAVATGEELRELGRKRKRRESTSQHRFTTG